MAEQTINYGEAMFTDIKPKEVLAGVKDAAVSWWNEFSPGTVARGDVEAFDRVVGRIKNESLRTTLHEKKGLFSAFAKARGVGTLVVDGALATIPFYAKWKTRLSEQIQYVKKVGAGVRDRVVNQTAGDWLYSKEGRQYAESQQDRVLTRLQGIDWLADLLGGSPRTLKHLESVKKMTRDRAIQQARNVLIESSDRLSPEGRKAVRKDMLGKLNDFKRGNTIALAGLAGVEAGVFAFRPATRLAKLQTKVLEKGSSWVVDHIVNNIVKGPNPVS